MQRFVRSAALIAAVCTLAACGGSPSSTPAVAAASGGASGPSTQGVTGVVIPSSVSVVTAKSAP
jgi:hypothetical protein